MGASTKRRLYALYFILCIHRWARVPSADDTLYFIHTDGREYQAQIILYTLYTQMGASTKLRPLTSKPTLLCGTLSLLRCFTLYALYFV